jgi:hypothetical protein
MDSEDPIKVCQLYKDDGCSHVDGVLCDTKTCSMRLDYNNLIEAFELLDTEVK